MTRATVFLCCKDCMRCETVGREREGGEGGEGGECGECGEGGEDAGGRGRRGSAGCGAGVWGAGGGWMGGIVCGAVCVWGVRRDHRGRAGLQRAFRWEHIWRSVL